MVEHGGMRKYLYWSEPRVRAVAETHGVRLAGTGEPRGPGEPRGSGGLRGSGGPAWSAEAGGAEYAPRRMDRNDMALRIEMALGRCAVSDFAKPPPVRYAHGRGTVVLSEFAYEVEDPPIGFAFTDVTAADGCRVAVCLFGGIAAYSDVVTDVVPQAKGWSTASAAAIADLVRGRPEPRERHQRAASEPRRRRWTTACELASEVLRVATRQGEECSHDDVLVRPWKRGFTYGHVSDVAEWFAEVYLDVRVAELPGYGAGAGDGASASASAEDGDGDGHNGVDGYDRIVIGAPLWIRTPSLRALTLYDEIPAQELDLDIGRYE